jgi:hypothetical protein
MIYGSDAFGLIAPKRTINERLASIPAWVMCGRDEFVVGNVFGLILLVLPQRDASVGQTGKSTLRWKPPSGLKSDGAQGNHHNSFGGVAVLPPVVTPLPVPAPPGGLPVGYVPASR